MALKAHCIINSDLYSMSQHGVIYIFVPHRGQNDYFVVCSKSKRLIQVWWLYCQSPPVTLFWKDCPSMSAFGCAESYGGHRSLDNLPEVHPECVAPSLEPEGTELQPPGLCYRMGPSCRNCLEVGGARTH